MLFVGHAAARYVDWRGLRGSSRATPSQLICKPLDRSDESVCYHVNRDQLRVLLATTEARALDPASIIWQLDEGPWWRLFNRHRELEATKLSVLEAAWQLPEPMFLRLPEDPSATDLRALLLEQPNGVWAVDTRRTVRAFYGVELSYGNWFLYSAAQPWTGIVPNTFKTSPAELIAFMDRTGIVFFVDAFYDDIEWRVGIARGPG